MELWIIYNDEYMCNTMRLSLILEDIRLKIKEFNDIVDAILEEGHPDFVFIDIASATIFTEFLRADSMASDLCLQLALKHQSANFALFSEIKGWAEETLSEMKGSLEDTNIIFDIIYNIDDFVNWIKKYYKNNKTKEI